MIAFALTIFTGAFLLFQVQPLIAKYILPWFGGGPAVWTTCLLFFQVFLLGGYAYAHFSARWLRPRAQALLHLALLAASLASLPIIPDGHWKPADPEHPTWRILTLLTASVGLPYFVLSATGPLIQHWFSVAKPGVSPYRLYALSNAGSLLALVSYPFLFEPLLARNTQALVWAWGLGLYAVCTTATALRLWRSDSTNAETTGLVSDSQPDPAPPWNAQLLWLLLPACASVLLLAITNKICQEVAVVPFLWILPLGLYLLSFILCFDSPHWYLWKFYLAALVPTLALLCFLMFERMLPLLIQVIILAWALFNCCMICHGELYRLKPAPRHLTRFYLMIAAGGALGGVLVAVVAPLVLHDYHEMHGGLLLLVALLAFVLRDRGEVKVAGRPVPAWRLAAAGGVVLLVVLGSQALHSARQNIAVHRNFYGVLRVIQQFPRDPLHRALELRCGPIMHGVQVVHPAYHLMPMSYYHDRSGLSMAFDAMPRQDHRRIGVIGLGVGTLAVHGRAGDAIRFYEINPAVKQFAERHFTFLRHSTAQVEVVLGDARLSLERESPQQYDLLVLDAFNGDAIPTHLLTQECFATYLRHLKPDGVIAAHISNQHLDLVPVLKNVAAAFQLSLASIPVEKPRLPSPWMFPTHWCLLTRNKELLSHPSIQIAARRGQEGGKKVPLWTDDYASLFPILK